MKTKNSNISRIWRSGGPALALALAFAGLWSLIALAQGGGAWNQVQPAHSPGARYGHSLVVSNDGSAIVFGGENDAGGAYSDLAAYKNEDWQPLVPGGTPPTGRAGHSMAALGDGSAVLFGGKNGAGETLNDLAVLENNQWRQETPANSPPPGRAYHGSAVLGDGRMAVVGGVGAGGTALDDIWFYKPSDRTWSQGANAPTTFAGPGVAAQGNEVYVLGRWDNAVYVYDAEQDAWRQESYTPGSLPMLRKYAAVAQYANRVWLFGGENYYNPNVVYSDTWEFNLSTLEWKQLEDMPVALSGAAAAVHSDVISGTQGLAAPQAFEPVGVLLFGGKGSDGAVISTTYTFQAPAAAYQVFLPLVVAQ